MKNKVMDIFKQYGMRIFIVTFLVIDMILVGLIIHYRTGSDEDTLTVGTDFNKTMIAPDDSIDVTMPDANVNVEVDSE